MTARDTWFEGSGTIQVSLETVAADLADYGRHCVGVLAHMPGLTAVELKDDSGSSVTIQTNEGTMTRSGISRQTNGALNLDFDETYETKGITVHSHYHHEFKAAPDGVSHRLVISDVRAAGLLGFFYRKFGKARIGQAALDSYQTYFEGN